MIEKIIEMFKEKRDNASLECAAWKRGNAYERADGRRCAFIDAIEIVQEVAKDGGWIPCSERLPEKDGYYLITMQYYHLHNPVVMGCIFEDGEWWKIDKDDEVLAWMELPAPYQKGE